MLTHTIVKGKDCGMPVFRLLVWNEGTLVLCKTHMSVAGAETQWMTLQNRAKTASNKAKEGSV